MDGAAGQRYRWTHCRSPVECPVGRLLPEAISPILVANSIAEANRGRTELSPTNGAAG